MLCATPVAAAVLYRSTLKFRLQTARKRKLAGWSSTTTVTWGTRRITYIPRHEAVQVLWSFFFPPLLIGTMVKGMWWDLLSVPEALVSDEDEHQKR